MTVTNRCYSVRGHIRTLVGSLCCAFAGLALPSHLRADVDSSALLPSVDSNDTRPATGVTAAALERREIAERLASVRESIDQLKASSSEIPDHLAEQLELLKWLDLLVSHRDALRTRITESEAKLQRVEKDFESLRANGISETQSRSFAKLDDARDQLVAEQARSESIRLEIDTVEATLSSAREAYENAERARRSARESLETASDPETKEDLARRHMLAEMRSRAHGEELRQQERELEVAQLQRQITKIRVEYLQEEVRQLREVTQFTPQDLQERMALLDKVEAQFQQQLGQLQSSLKEVERQWLEAKRQLEHSAASDAVLAEEVSTWKLARELQHEQVALLKQVTAYVGFVRICWRRRYELANGQASTEDIAQWQEELDKSREHLGQLKQLVAIRADDRLGDLATARKRLLVLGEVDQKLSGWLQRQTDELDKAISGYGSQLAIIKTAQRLVDRFGEEVDEVVRTKSASQRLAQLAQLLKTGWNYEIVSVDDRPITVSKIVRGLILLLVGFLMARWLSRILGNRMLPRFGVNQGASMALQTISFYVMLTCCGFLALELINLPLTVFAFMGGAIAIGVGFGSQNVLNNFISGLILMAERPIRVGDLVDIDGLNGTVEQIGARSTRVRTGSNLEIIVPNSKFLENNVTNWTLSNTQIRTMVSVGVAYGSPTREVNRLLRQVIAENEAVLKVPEPIILFKEFGDNSLLFEVHFWLHMRTVMQAEKAASEVRHAIDDAFDEAKITIAFPQRDVHLDATAPIEVNVRQVEQAISQWESRKMAA